ncbi:MAG TPA: aa3-type cytochrome c oxidase subunit IV [Roseovarius sp.]|nr:aa3-type cytochrome c oxidase subunit IV [Roseovarius sp.]
MAEHKHGDMDIEVQEKTFDGFMKAVTWSSVAIVVLLLFIAAVNG